ncbi:MAG: ABC transporter ATP-binding protein/permease [Methanoregula sp.]|nr:ABC transporter ATP-binding protein/permease [Methanoregula sp.]
MKIDSENIQTIIFFLKPYKLHLVLLFFLGILMAVFDFINIALLYPILSISTNQSYHPDNVFYNFIFYLDSLCSTILNIHDPLISSCILFIGFAILSFFFGLLYILLSLQITTKITIENKKKIFEKQNQADYQYYLDHKQGDLIYKTTRAPAFIAEVFNNLTKMSIDIILSISTIILLLSISFKGSLILLCAGAGYYSMTRYLSLKVSYITGTGRYKASQQENVILNEFINGIKQIKVYGVAQRWKRQYDETIDEFWKLWRKDSFWLQVPALLLYLCIFVAIGVVVIIIKLFYPLDFLTYLPILGTFALAILKLLPRLANFGNYQMGIMSALPNLKIVQTVLEDPTYVNVKNGTLPFHTKKPDIVINNITFGYLNREPIFTGLSLQIDAGKTTALVGASGSGKSTIIDLILRMYDVEKGEILIDSVDIRNFDINTLHEKMGFVSQETFIYNASIQDNIAFGRDYPKEKIIEAAKQANIHDMISQLPQQYDTPVGDRGIKLSGGERQRIAIARAIIGDPELLILDEATSSLDNVSERSVQDAINNVAKKCTTIIVAHRLSTVRDADIIYVLENGKIIESGTHDQLMGRKSKYWEMYTRQVNV